MDASACEKCGGPHRYDTSVPSVLWNSVVRSQGWDFLCAACILELFALARVTLTAELSGDGLSGVPIVIEVDGLPAQHGAALCAQNTELRAALREIEQTATRAIDMACRAPRRLTSLPDGSSPEAGGTQDERGVDASKARSGERNPFSGNRT